jgi:hypothetical protein
MGYLVIERINVQGGILKTGLKQKIRKKPPEQIDHR